MEESRVSVPGGGNTLNKRARADWAGAWDKGYKEEKATWAGFRAHGSWNRSRLVETPCMPILFVMVSLDPSSQFPPLGHYMLRLGGSKQAWLPSQTTLLNPFQQIFTAYLLWHGMALSAENTRAPHGSSSHGTYWSH